MAVVVNLDDSGMLKGGNGADFISKSGVEGPVLGKPLGQDLEGDIDAGTGMAGAKDGGHCALAEFLLEDEG